MVSPQTSTHNNHMFPHYHPPPEHHPVSSKWKANCQRAPTSKCDEISGETFWPVFSTPNTLEN